MGAFFGMRGTGDWVTDQRPKNFRELVLFLYPNGMVPFTAMLSKMKTRIVDDPDFNWWEKGLAAQGGAVTQVYDDAGLSTAYSGATGIIGTTVYAKCAEAVADHFRVGHTAMLRDADQPTYDTVGEVVNVTKNGASSYVSVKLVQADQGDLAGCDRVLIVGSVNSEGSSAPRGINYDPTKRYNYTQIFRTTTEITGTAEETALRTGPQKKENLRECLELHTMEIEKAFLWGQRYEGVGDNGKPKRFTWGMIPMIKSLASDNVSSYITSTNSDYAGKTWIQAGKKWLDYYLSLLFRFGSSDKLAFCGYQVLTAINELAEQYGVVNLEVKDAGYGLKVTEWVTPFGVLYFKTHPLFSYESTNSRAAVIFEPKNTIYCHLKNRDTKLQKNIQDNDVDGTIDGYLTECGLEYHHPETFMYLDGFGATNTQ